MWVGGQRHAPAALPPGNTRYQLYRRLGGPQGRSGRVRKISPLPGFDPRTVQPVASRYTDWAIPAHTWSCTSNKSQAYAFMGPCSVNFRDIFTKIARTLLTIAVNVTLSRKLLHHTVNFHIPLFRTDKSTNSFFYTIRSIPDRPYISRFAAMCLLYIRSVYASATIQAINYTYVLICCLKCG
jgi:hypothetical protein